MAALILKRQIPLTFHPANDRDGAAKRPLVVFVHHFGGSSTTSKRHVSAVNEMGFDAVTFSLSWHGQEMRISSLTPFYWAWAAEIRQVLKQCGERPKILFTFSGPGAIALKVIASKLEMRGQSGKPSDIVGMICDSGPFVDPWFCTRRLVEQIYGITQPLKREAVLFAMMTFWGYGHNHRLHRNVATIARLEPGFRILSIRSLNDTLVPAEKIAAVFDDSGLKDVRALNLESAHLTGLKDHPVEYKSALSEFFSPWT